MNSERDLVEDLAEEIRAAVARAAPPAGAAATPAAHASLPAAELRVPLGRAHAHITPSIPPGARLSRIKRLALRVLRFLWRDQAGFNALLVETAGGLADAIEEARQRLEGLEEERQRLEHLEEEDRRLLLALRELEERLESNRTGWETARQELLERVEREESALEERMAGWGRRAAIEDGRLAILERGSGPHPAVLPASVPSLPPGVYSLFEERFRGSPEQIAENQRSYLPLLEAVPGPVLDVGSGRGELPAQGRHPGFRRRDQPDRGFGQCRRRASPWRRGRPRGGAREKPDGSLRRDRRLPGGRALARRDDPAFLREAAAPLARRSPSSSRRSTRTPLSALKPFFLDPSHVRPVPPEALRFLAEAAGFADARIEYRAPIAESDRLKESSENDAKLNRLLFGPQDYAPDRARPGVKRPDHPNLSGPFSPPSPRGARSVTSGG